MSDSPIRVLVVEDEPSDAHLFRAALSSDRRFEVARGSGSLLSEALARVSEEPPDVILLDLHLPDSAGLDTLRRTTAAAPNVPVLVISAADDPNLAMQAVQEGAQDYLVKSKITRGVLERTLRYAVERNRLVFELQRKTEQARAAETSVREIIEHSADGIIVLDREGVARLANRAAATILDRPRDAILGERFDLTDVQDGMELEVPRRDGSVGFVSARLARTSLSGEEVLLASLRDVTLRRQQERELRALAEELEDRTRVLRPVLECMAEGVAVVDASGEFLLLNRAAEGLLGPRLGPLGTTLPPATSGARGHATERILPAEDQPLSRALRGEHTDDEEILLEITGEARGGVAVFRDVTERRTAVQRLRESEERHRLFFERNLAASFIVSAAGELLACNPAFATMAGHASVADALSSDLAILFPTAQDRERFLARVRSEQAIRDYERVLHDARGEERHVIGTAVGRFSEADELLDVTGFLFDVTERKEAEAARDLLATALDQAPEALIITDTEGRILYTNAAFETVTEFTREEALGKNPRILRSDEHPDEFYAEMWGALSRGSTWERRLVNQRKDGSLYQADAVIAPVRDGDGAIVNYVALHRDVTREVELELQLRGSQKLEALGRLAGGAAHDFNNQLTVIRSTTELLLSEVDPGSSLASDLQEIQDAVDRSASLTKQLLAFGRRQVFEPKVIDLNEIVGGLQKMLHRLVPVNVEMVVDLAEDLGAVKADPGQVEQIIANLVVNARDAMPDGGTLTIRTLNRVVEEDPGDGASPRPGAYVALFISDTGHGMDEKTRARVFEPFFTTKHDKGTGLGLATVYGIAKQSGGFIEPDTRPDEGARFSILLPCAPAVGAFESARDGAMRAQ